MKRSDIAAMSMEELKELAKQKQKNGTATPDAYAAQCEIAARSDCLICCRHRYTPKHLSDEYLGPDIDYGEDWI